MSTDHQFTGDTLMFKTLSFATIHFIIAFSVAYLLTGDFLLGSLIALIEPSVNTIAYYYHEKIWTKTSWLSGIQNNSKIKTVSFACLHFNVAFIVSYLISGDIIIGGVMALIEPAINSVAYYFHELFWKRRMSLITSLSAKIQTV